MYRATRAIQNVGIEMPARETTRSAWSVGRFQRTAAMTPKGTPKRIAISVEKIASSAVAGTYVARFCRTGW